MPPPSTLRIFYKDRSSGLAPGILVEAEPTIMRGPPKRKDRKVIGALIGAVTGFVPLLIAFVFFSDFPGGSQEGTQNVQPPPEDVSCDGMVKERCPSSCEW
jgi:hypothetical protein